MPIKITPRPALPLPHVSAPQLLHGGEFNGIAANLQALGVANGVTLPTLRTYEPGFRLINGDDFNLLIAAAKTLAAAGVISLPPINKVEPGHRLLDATALDLLATAIRPATNAAGVLNIPAAYAFFANVNFQGLDGGNVFPGTEGTDFFAASASDLAYVKARATGPARLPFLWERMQPSLNGALDATYLAKVKGVADAALAQGTQVFLDCHNYMRRPVFSQVATAPYTISAYRGVDNPDGVVTRAHLVDLWTKLATYFKGHAGIYGYDIMNEPTSDNAFGATSSSANLALIMQACVNAIAAVDTSVVIFVEGNSYSSCKSWLANTSYPLSDPTSQIVYSAHCYPDYDHSGTHFGYAQNTAPPSGDALVATTLVDLSTNFANWCQTNNVRGHIGETNVGIDNPAWNTVLDNGLAYWKTKNIGVSLWLFGANFGSNPYNLYPYGGAGTQAPQWKAVQKNTGVGVSALVLSGPRNGTAGQASLPIQVSCPGYLAVDTVVTLSDGGQGGTFTPSTVTLPGGIGASTIQTVTYNQPATKGVTISATASGLTTGSFGYTTDPANPAASYAMASPKFSDWSQSNGSLTTNSTFATDASGGNTSARIADNGSNVQHVFNGPPISVLPGQPFEDQRVLKGVGSQFARMYVTGDSGASFGIDVDLVGGIIMSGIGSGGGTLLDATISALSGGFFTVRTKGTLGSAAGNARQWVALEGGTSGVTVYAGAGADAYMDSTAAVPNTIYVGPIHTFAGKPVNTAKPNSSYSSGTGAVGSVIAVSNGLWTGSPTSYAYGYLRDGVAIAGQTGATYTTVTADSGHTVTPTVTATNANGASRTISAQGLAIGATAYVPLNDNLITTQVLTNAAWGKIGTVTVTPNYGIAPDGTLTASRVQITGDFSNALTFALPSHPAAGFQSVSVRTNPTTGDAAAYFCLRSAGLDHDFNVDNSGGAQGRPTATWFRASADVFANEGFRMQGRGSTIDILVWGLKVNEGASVTGTASTY